MNRGSTTTVVLRFGDVAKLVVERDGRSSTRIAIWQSGEDEPLIDADLTDEERRRLVKALQDGGPTPVSSLVMRVREACAPRKRKPEQFQPVAA